MPLTHKLLSSVTSPKRPSKYGKRKSLHEETPQKGKPLTTDALAVRKQLVISPDTDDIEHDLDNFGDQRENEWIITAQEYVRTGRMSILRHAYQSLSPENRREYTQLNCLMIEILASQGSLDESVALYTKLFEENPRGEYTYAIFEQIGKYGTDQDIQQFYEQNKDNCFLDVCMLNIYKDRSSPDRTQEFYDCRSEECLKVLKPLLPFEGWGISVQIEALRQRLTQGIQQLQNARLEQVIQESPPTDARNLDVIQSFYQSLYLPNDRSRQFQFRALAAFSHIQAESFFEGILTESRGPLLTMEMGKHLFRERGDFEASQILGAIPMQDWDTELKEAALFAYCQSNKIDQAVNCFDLIPKTEQTLEMKKAILALYHHHNLFDQYKTLFLTLDTVNQSGPELHNYLELVQQQQMTTPILSEDKPVDLDVVLAQPFGNPCSTCDITVIIPMRLPSPEHHLDHTPLELLTMWKEALAQTNPDSTVHFVFGINARTDSLGQFEEQIPQIAADMQRLCAESPNISGECVFFTWKTIDDSVPYGSFRNLLLNRQRPSTKTIASLDADVSVTPRMVDYVHEFQREHADQPLAFQATGYRLDFDPSQKWMVRASQLDLDIRRAVNFWDNELERYVPVCYLSEACNLITGTALSEHRQSIRYSTFGMDAAGLRKTLERDGVYPEPFPELDYPNVPCVTNTQRFEKPDTPTALYTLAETHANTRTMAARIGSALSIQSVQAQKATRLFSPWSLLKYGMSWEQLSNYGKVITNLAHDLTRLDQHGLKQKYKLGAYFSHSPKNNLPSLLRDIFKLDDLSEFRAPEHANLVTAVRMMVKWFQAIMTFLESLDPKDRDEIQQTIKEPQNSRNGCVNGKAFFKSTSSKKQKKWDRRLTGGVAPRTHGERCDVRKKDGLSPGVQDWRGNRFTFDNFDEDPLPKIEESHMDCEPTSPASQAAGAAHQAHRLPEIKTKLSPNIWETLDQKTTTTIEKTPDTFQKFLKFYNSPEANQFTALFHPPSAGYRLTYSPFEEKVMLFNLFIRIGLDFNVENLQIIIQSLNSTQDHQRSPRKRSSRTH